MNHYEKSYHSLLRDIIDNGTVKESRVGKTRSLFGKTIEADLSEGFPILTTKKVSIDNIVTELAWFISGDTNIKFLIENGCNIWNDDLYRYYYERHLRLVAAGAMPSKEEFFKQYIWHRDQPKEGDLGKVYGYQWNRLVRSHSDVNKKVPQLVNTVTLLKKDPTNRRLLVNAWDADDLPDMALPPCHYGFQLNTNPVYSDESSVPDYYKLDLLWNQRSVDVPLGLPYNVASYAILLHLICLAVTDLNMRYVPGKIIGMLGDVHVYENQVDACETLLSRGIHDTLPTLNISNELKVAANEIFSSNTPKIKEFVKGHITLENYNPQSFIKIPLST
jgi:thymidylate synthase